LRKELPTVKNDGMKQKLSEYLTTVLKEGIAFYSGFVDIIEEKFLDFKATHFIDINYYDRCIDLLRKNPATNTVTTIRTKETKYALNLINRCWLSLGDLERYLLTTTCIQSETSYDGSKSNLDYSVSRNYYLKATGLMPKSSRAYHQLAVLAMYTKKPLEACYYYFRCLEVTIPLDGVRQSLNALFAEQESRLKSQLKNKMAKKFTNRIGPDKEIEHKKKTTPSSRVELWFNPSFNTNNTNKVDEDIDKDDDLDKESTSSFSSSLSDSDDEDAQVASIQKSFRGIFSSKIKKSSNELKKCFTLNYLNAIGRLFTKVGMETYPEICRNALKQFNLLINQQPCVLSIINLNIVNYLKIKSKIQLLLFK
jgi:protein SMG6